MKLSQIMQYINQALNYPSLNFIDIDIFLNMAIAELNTTLHISMPSISQMQDLFKQQVSKEISKQEVVLTTDPTVYPEIVIIPKYKENTAYLANEYISYNEKLYKILENISDVSNTQFSDLTVEECNIISINNKILQYFYNEDLNKFAILKRPISKYEYYNNIFGIYVRNGVYELYESYDSSVNPIWVTSNLNYEDFDIIEFLPDDWIYLWVIPYVCFKYTCRDGGTAQTFAEELTQGFQQLQNSYNVPDTVILSTVVEKLAYSDLVKANLENLNIKVRTRAIYESMKHSRNINGIFGSMYDRGGFL